MKHSFYNSVYAAYLPCFRNMKPPPFLEPINRRMERSPLTRPHPPILPLPRIEDCLVQVCRTHVTIPLGPEMGIVSLEVHETNWRTALWKRKVDSTCYPANLPMNTETRYPDLAVPSGSLMCWRGRPRTLGFWSRGDNARAIPDLGAFRLVRQCATRWVTGLDLNSWTAP